MIRKKQQRQKRTQKTLDSSSSISDFGGRNETNKF